MQKGNTMNKILEYFHEELSQNNEYKKKIEDEIHRAEIDIEFISKAKQKMYSELDNTYNIFSANDPDINFNSREISSLNDKINQLNCFVEKQSDELKCIENKIAVLSEMITEYNRITQKDNTAMSGFDILKIQEIERQRIARDIHDSTVQKLTALIHKSEFTMKVIENDPMRAKIELEIMNKVAKDCISDLRGIIFNLRPMSLDDLGMEITIRRAIAQLNSMTDMNINLDFNSDIKFEINPIISITVLRIIQELCSNSIKYSQGKNININITIDDSMIYVVFFDDGIGIKETDISSDRKDNTGFGIQFLRERVRLLGGIIVLEKNGDNEGIRYKIEIPCHNEETRNDD